MLGSEPVGEGLDDPLFDSRRTDREFRGSVDEVVAAAVQEDADAVCVSSYQGGHMEYFSFLVDRLREQGCGHVQVYGGGGGTITAEARQDSMRFA